MQTTKVSLLSSLYGLLTKPKPDLTDTKRQVEFIRTAMSEAMAHAQEVGFEHVARRVRNAADIEALWYLRADVMQAIATTEGESTAKRRMGRITPLFAGLLPRGLNSRPSPLSER
ncbi:hypothetical protein [Variovorax sp. HJSM1_2]|uniref:hypothetical protein n=1 Tax=Variovorax sp. HJSM1_2 TaxID=3366263 RepID=UPI003BDBF613